MKLSVVGLALGLSVAVAPAALARPKYVAHGWDLLNVSPEEVLQNADAFRRTGVDGVTLMVRQKMSDGFLVSFQKGIVDYVWPKDVRQHLQGKVEVLRQIVKRPGLEESILNVWLSPLKRLSWTNDCAWANFATNMATAAWMAKAAGLRGWFVDNEDYRRSRQYFWDPKADPSFDETLALARRRGREVFGAVFREYPDIVMLAFWLYMQEMEWGRPVLQDPVAVVRENGRLWPAFLDGMWDVMPPAARAVEGNEFAYPYSAARNDFFRSACNQRTCLVRAASPENQAKVRAQMGVGFGLYLDDYPKGLQYQWYPGATGDPVRDFRANLEQASEATDDYVWIYGEKSVWIPWKNLAQKRWEEAPVWNETLPGICDVLRQMGHPDEFLRTSIAEGVATNLVADLKACTSYYHEPKDPEGRWTISPTSLAAEGPARGVFQVSVKNVKPGERYQFGFRATGSFKVGLVCWRRDGHWDWDKLRVSYVEFDGRAPGNRVNSQTTVLVPEGADEVVFQLKVKLEKGERVLFEDLAAIQVRR